MKKLIAISAMTLIISTFGVASKAETVSTNNTQTDSTVFLTVLVQMHQEQTLLEEQQAEFFAAQARAETMQSRIRELSQHVDSTWYAFAGATPQGWDCSGLVLWFYKKFDIELEHSATKQMLSGELTEDPMPGDIVSFNYPGSDRSYHNGIYIGNGLMIDSPRPGNKTRVRGVEDFAGSTEINYTRININVVE